MDIKMRAFNWFLFIYAIRTLGFSVRGPEKPVIAQLGASVTLPCSVDTPIPLRGLEVLWRREDSGELVHLFLEGKSWPDSQNPLYIGRAEFFTKEVSKGNFSLLLRNVTTEDKGLYKCVVHTDHASNETKVKIDFEQLVVTGAARPLFAYAGEDVILNCSVDTNVPLRELEVEWMKTNGEILVLLFSEGQNRPESQHERFIGRSEFFIDEIPKGNFSMKLRDVKTEDKGEYMCKLHTDRESFNATAWLQGLGFSTLHRSVLFLSIGAALVAVLSCIPAVWCIIKKGESKRVLWLYCLQVSIPCILISIAFIIWGTIESSVGEAYVCSSLNLMRILVIFKMSPYMGLFPGKFQGIFILMALPLEYLVIATGINSVLHQLLTENVPDTWVKRLPGLLFGLELLCGLIAVCVSGFGLVKWYRSAKSCERNQIVKSREWYLSAKSCERNQIVKSHEWNQLVKSHEWNQLVKSHAWNQLVKAHAWNQLVKSHAWNQLVKSHAFLEFGEFLEFEEWNQIVKSYALSEFEEWYRSANPCEWNQIVESWELSQFEEWYRSAKPCDLLQLVERDQTVRSYAWYWIVKSREWNQIVKSCEWNQTVRSYGWYWIVRSRQWNRIVKSCEYILAGLFLLCSIFQTVFCILIMESKPALEKDEERPAVICFCVFLFILTATVALPQKLHFPISVSFVVPHILVYVFGSAVLSVFNSLALTTEVILKAEKGERTVEDLRVLILPLDCIFFAFWIALMVYKRFLEKRNMTEEAEQMDLFSPVRSTAQTEGKHG